MQRPNATSSPGATWYVKGSYVLDVLFETAFAMDVDVFYDSARGQPSRDQIRSWMRAANLPQTKAEPDIVATYDMDACNGGGEPVLNIDQWHVRMDGVIYTLEATTIETDELERTMNRLPPTKMRPVPLERHFATGMQIEVLPWVSEDDLDAERIVKTLAKMVRHPSLRNASLERVLERLLDSR